MGKRPRSSVFILVVFHGSLFGLPQQGLGLCLPCRLWEQVGMAWALHDAALLFTEGRLLHG